MIVQLILAAAIGLVTGASADALLRGRDGHSTAVVIAGLAGALGGAAVRYLSGSDDLLLVVTSAIAGGLLLAFITRARLSARLEQSRRRV